MILHLRRDLPEEKIQEMVTDLEAYRIDTGGMPVLIISSKYKVVPDAWTDFVDEYHVMDTDIQLASRTYLPETRSIALGDVEFCSSNTVMISGPCAVENWDQIHASASFLKESGVKFMRAGSYKPRTSPYTFQGLGLEGLKMLAKIREEFGLKIVTEAKDATHVDQVIEYADIVQVGAKAMYDQGILKACGRAKKPILIKRGFGSTLQEFVQAAEFVLSAGNSQVMLCERGIRSFETGTRFTLDLCGVAFLKEQTNLPIILDPSHAMGHAYGVADLTRACVAMGVEGLLIETHPTPSKAWSDAAQQLDFEAFSAMQASLDPIAGAVGRKMM